VDIYTLDADFNKTSIIEDYSSWIWTDRYSGYGDIQIMMKATAENLARYRIDDYVAKAGSDRVMVIETREILGDGPNDKLLKVSGRSLESIMFRRNHRGVLDQDINPNDRSASTLIRKIVDVNMISGGYAATTGSFPAGTSIPTLRLGTNAPASANVYKGQDKAKYAYDVVKAVADVAGLGFKITVPQVLLPTVTQTGMVFDTYAGVDRTSGNPAGNEVISFRPDLENLANTKYLESKAALKNVAWMIMTGQDYSEFGTYLEIDTAGNQWPYGNAVTGLNKRNLIVEVSDIPYLNDGSGFTTEWYNLVSQRAVEELAKYRAMQIFDGEIQSTGPYKMNFDYYLGDIVEVRNELGLSAKTRVSEYIESSDSNGFRAYPAFTLLETL
jgi:hypothetical protein